jgi:galactokinase
LITELGYLGALADDRQLADRLAQTGLGRTAAVSKAELVARSAAALRAQSPDIGDEEVHAFYVPGRIEVLGKHTDYAGGRTMVAAADRGFAVVVSPARGPTVRVIDVLQGESTEFALDPELAPPVGHWSNYPMTVARRVARNFPSARQGATIALASDLPPAAGMSSSSALMVSIFLALDAVNRLQESEPFGRNISSLTDLAGYLGTVENGQTFGTLAGDRGVGTFGGSEDHTAMLCARAGHVSQYAYCPVVFERAVPIPPGYTFAIAVSGVVAEKTGAAMAKYNRASRLVSALLQQWREATGQTHQHLARALASSPQAAEQLMGLVRQSQGGEFSANDLLTRLEHFLVENDQVVPRAGDALGAGDLAGFARAVDRSQEAAEELLGNQVPETVALAAEARAAGALTASAFGAGFGGSVWALVEMGRSGRFLDAWTQAYRVRFPEHAARSKFFLTGAGPAACRIC